MKPRRCNVCRVTFQRAYTLKQHMKTKHKQFVLKAICPLCDWAISTTTNMRVHLNRHHRRHGKEIPLVNGIIQGKPLKWVWIEKRDLMNGRYYGTYDSSDDDSTPAASSTYDEDDEMPLRMPPNLSAAAADDMTSTDALIDYTADNEQQPLHTPQEMVSDDDTR